MKPNSTLALTLILLSSMFMVGIVSAAWGFTFGTKALKGITQPAISPVLGGITNKSRSPQRGSTFIQEEDILKKVKTRISGSTKS